jgi:uncharacterized YigZ family protein
VIRYASVVREAEIEQIIERSRFIGCAAPARSREEAEVFFAARRTLHRAATHNVPALVLGEKGELEWAGDDGEPQGTAGPPILRMLVAEGLTNIAVMVTRYFGGVKLGTGGLVRAYTNAARAAVAAAGLCDVCETALLTYRVDYSFFGKLQNAAKQGGAFGIEDAIFADAVTATLTGPSEHADALAALVADITGGAGELLGRGTRLVAVPRQS